VYFFALAFIFEGAWTMSLRSTFYCAWTHCNDHQRGQWQNAFCFYGFVHSWRLASWGGTPVWFPQ